MQRFKTNKYFQPHKLFLLLLALTVLLPAGGAFGQEKKKKKKKTKYFELRVGLAMVYDDNILKYSEKYLNRFMNGEDEGRFHIETYDDLIINPSLEVICRPKIFKKAKTRINASISPKIYAVNNIKDWLYWGVGFQQYITKSASIKILYSYIPDFYVRHFVWKLPKLAKRSNNLDVDFLLLNRYYSSPYSPLVDKLHAGRYDKNYRIYATYNITLKKYLKLSLFYNWLMRDTDTKALINSDYVSSEKDYHENKIGFKLVYNLKF
ncbi:MAG: hypothetical protein B6I19_09910 [Bacteroidetes bacterium 4572_114]|nr:MAG: hypothetical protein B6I19_09910 [Bacteroidetes bacterium 4572_114]